MIYTGIGSRETPDKVLGIMYTLGALLAKRGFTLRSGGADGADNAFEAGCDSIEGCKEIYLPWIGFNGKDGIFIQDKSILKKATDIAKTVHPAWDKCSSGAKNLHSRNIFQILGADLLTPTEFVICWTKSGQDVGGTRTAIVLAKEHNIPVYNLANKNTIKEILESL